MASRTIVATVATTDATPTVLWTAPTDFLAFRISVYANDGASGIATWEFTAATDDTFQLIQASLGTTESATAASWSAALSGPGDLLQIDVTGAAATNITWTAVVTYTSI